MRAYAAFCTRVSELGGEVLEPKWLGVMKPHRIRCAAGHEASPRPNSIQRGTGLCRTCAGRDSNAAWQAFLDCVAKSGGAVLEPAWKGTNKPHLVRCAVGHITDQRPGNVIVGGAS